MINTLSRWLLNIPAIRNATMGMLGAYQSNLYSGMMSGGTAGRNQDLTRDKAGAMLAFRIILPVFRSVQLRSQAVAATPWRIVRNADGQVVATSADYTVRHPLARMILDASRWHNESLFYLWEQSLSLYGENYIEKCLNRFNVPSGLRWLNPLAIQTQEAGGRVWGYMYITAGGSTTFKPNQLSFDRTPDPGDDLHGYSPTYAALDKINVDNNAHRWWAAHFRNGARQDVVISPDGEFKKTWNKEDQDVVAETLRMFSKGVDNAGRTRVWPFPIKVETQDPVDLSKQIPLSDAMETAIYAGYGVSRPAAGDTTSVRYKSAEEVYTYFYGGVIAEECKGIALETNSTLMPFVEGTEPGRCAHRFEFDLSEFDSLTEGEKTKREQARLDLAAGAITLNDYRKEIGLTDKPEGDVYYLPSGVSPRKPEELTAQSTPTQLTLFTAPQPAGSGVSPDAAPLIPGTTTADSDAAPENLASTQGLNGAQITAASQIISDATMGVISLTVARELLLALGIADDRVGRMIDSIKPASTLPEGSLRAVDEPPAASGSPAYVSIDLAHHPDIERTQGFLAEIFGGKLELQPSEHFHLTLVYGEDVTDEQLDAVNQVRPADAIILTSSRLIVLGGENGDRMALCAEVMPDPYLLALQRDVYKAVSDSDAELSDYSKPEAYRPHITLAHIPEGVDVGDVLPGVKSEFSVLARQVTAQRDDYQTAFTIALPTAGYEHWRRRASQADAEDELRAWENAVGLGKGQAAWEKAAARGKPRDFEPVHTRGDLSDWIAEELSHNWGDKGAVRSVFIEARKRLAYRAITDTEIAFGNEFYALMEAAAVGDSERRQWAAGVRRIIRQYGRQAYRDGLVDGGVDEDGLSAEDELEVSDLIRAQSEFVTNLGAKFFSEGLTMAEIANKPDMWTNKSLTPFYTAGLASANRNQMMEFGGEDGEESCETCQRLKGQRHRIKDWRRKGMVPREDTDNFECGGWRCVHKLIPVSGKARGAY